MPLFPKWLLDLFTTGGQIQRGDNHGLHSGKTPVFTAGEKGRGAHGGAGGAAFASGSGSVAMGGKGGDACCTPAVSPPLKQYVMPAKPVPVWSPESLNSWDRWFLEIAEVVAKKSKDPSTKVGAVIVRPNKTIASVGYNGFPRGVPDKPEWLNNRDEKYPRVLHAELNAILSCAERPENYILYLTPLAPCSQCAGAIIQSGIKEVVAFQNEEGVKRWGDSNQIALEMFRSAGVLVRIVK